LVRTALQTVNGRAGRVVHVSNPSLTRDEFFEYLAAGFGFSPQAARSKAAFLGELQAALNGCVPGRSVLALVFDEAQCLSGDLLEEIRLLTNLEAGNGAALTVVLVGQSELAVRLEQPDLRQLKQRVSLRCALAPLQLHETAAYIASRVHVAGGKAATIFTREAVLAIFEHSKGIPRTISVICDNALVSGFAADRRPIDRELVLEVCRDYALGVPLQGGEPRSLDRRDDPPRERPADRLDDRPIFSSFTRRRFSFF